MPHYPQTPGDDHPTRCQGRMVHSWTEVPPPALGTFDMVWQGIEGDGTPEGEQKAVRRLCVECKAAREAVGIKVTPHRFE